jgi:Bacteriorhodopsin-like protein
MTTQPIPWSAESEHRLRWRIQNAWAAMWVFIIAAVLCALIAFIDRWAWWLVGVAGFLGLAVFALRDLSHLRAELGEEMRRLPGGQFYEGSGMLANKPRSTKGLTRFIAWPRDSHSLLCECGRLQQWTNAHWIPNYNLDDGETLTDSNEVDPGGGRWVILCPCGLGHYKLKA